MKSGWQLECAMKSKSKEILFYIDYILFFHDILNGTTGNKVTKRFYFHLDGYLDMKAVVMVTQAHFLIQLLRLPYGTADQSENALCLGYLCLWVKFVFTCNACEDSEQMRNELFLLCAKSTQKGSQFNLLFSKIDAKYQK